MKIKHNWFGTEIDLKPGELTEILLTENPEVMAGLIRWIAKYLDFKFPQKTEEKNGTNT